MRSVALTALTIALSLCPLGPVTHIARADTCLFGAPMATADVIGSAFIGTIESIDRVDGVKHYHFHVERVIRQLDDPELLAEGNSLTIPAEQCIGVMTLQVGLRYLISTSDLAHAPMRRTAVWRLDGGTAHFIPTAKRVGAHDLRRARTVRDVIALIGPTTVGPWPTISTLGDRLTQFLKCLHWLLEHITETGASTFSRFLMCLTSLKIGAPALADLERCG